MGWYGGGIYRKCVSDCAVSLIPDRKAAVGDAKRCPHGQLYVCREITSGVPLAIWRRLSRVWEYRECKEAVRKLN